MVHRHKSQSPGFLDGFSFDSNRTYLYQRKLLLSRGFCGSYQRVNGLGPGPSFEILLLFLLLDFEFLWLDRLGRWKIMIAVAVAVLVAVAVDVDVAVYIRVGFALDQRRLR